MVALLKVAVAVTAGACLALLAGWVAGLLAAAVVLATATAGPRVREVDWRAFRAWWRLQTRPLGKGAAVASVSAVWPALRRMLRPDLVWVIYPGTERHKRAYVPPWLERTLREIVPTGLMRFGRYWGVVVSTRVTAEDLEREPSLLQGLLDDVRGQFPGVPIALAGRLPSIAASTGLELDAPFTRGDRGTVSGMMGCAREAARTLGKAPSEVTFAVVGGKGFIGARLVKGLAPEFAEVISLDSRYSERWRDGEGVLHTNEAADVARADAVFVLTPRGEDMESITQYVSPGAVVADDTHPPMPVSLRERLERRGATVLKAALGDDRFRFIPPVPDFRADDIPGCILEALVVVERGEQVLASQEAFDRAAGELGFRARLAPHRDRVRAKEVAALEGRVATGETGERLTTPKAGAPGASRPPGGGSPPTPYRPG